MCSLEWVCKRARNEGIRAVRSTRDVNPHVFAQYFNAAVSNHFLRSAQGRVLLAAADTTSHALLAAARAQHRAGAAGALDAFEWGMVRKLFPSGPAALHLWAKEAHHPAAADNRTFPIGPASVDSVVVRRGVSVDGTACARRQHER